MKGFELTLFRTRVAKRVFVLFVATILLPVVATGLLAIQQIGEALTGTADQQLGATSRGYGQMVYRRLMLADEALSRLPADPKLFDADRDEPIEFDAVVAVDGDSVVPIYGELDIFAARQLAAAVAQRSALGVQRTSTSTVLLMARRPTEDRIFVGRVSPSYLWDQYTLAYEQDICVLAGTNAAPLFCTAPLPEAQRIRLSQPGSSSSGHVTWKEGAQSYRAAYWELFTPSGFDGVPWKVVAFVDDSIALASLIAFERVFPILLLITLISVILLSIWQIRRSMIPLDELVAGTRRIANREFEQPMRLDRRDEFGDLAKALNSMSSRLGRQFAALSTLAEIDRLILSADDLEQVLQTALAATRTVLPCDAASVVLLDRESPDMGKFYFLEHGGQSSSGSVSRLSVDETDRDVLRKDPRVHELGTAGAPVLRAFAEAGIERALVFPISTNQAFAGALVLGFRNPQDASTDGCQPARDLADRLAVAVSASEREAVLFSQAHFDPLTGLPNRQLCRDRLHQAVAQARRNEHELALLFLDLDGFKTINDSLGHSAGDMLLRETSSRLLACIRDTDTVARLGGDEFVVILPQVAGITEIEVLAKKIMASLARPVQIDGKDVFVTVSIGVTRFPEDGDTVEGLLQRADAAMYDAKAAGRSRYVFFTNEITERATERLSLETDLRVALERDEFSLRYQPQLRLASEDVQCAEVLLRWMHPRRGYVSPGLFIPILEDMGLIDVVGDWVLSAALEQLSSWQAEGLPLQKVAVNVSAKQLRQRQFAERLTDILQVYELPARCLELEITESVYLEDMDQSNATLRVLRELGVQVSIDDFGTGYSSFSYLRDLQFDAVKIDRAFVRDLVDHRAIAITKAIVAVAQTLDKAVIAEGVETDIQLSRLRSLGVDAAQGFLICRPLEAVDFARWVASTAAGEDLSPSLIVRAIGHA